MNESWLIPFLGEKFSGPTSCQFLWHKNNIYVMDNHRLALWCWIQELNKLNVPNGQKELNLFHLDAHYDCAPLSEINSILDWSKLSSMNLSEFMNLSDAQGKKAIQWDNYWTLFWKYIPKEVTINRSLATTHKIGIKGDFKIEYEITDLMKYLDDQLIRGHHWLINLDLDYFFARSYKKSPLFSDDYIIELFKIIKTAYDENRFVALTVALSPECCGGWNNAKHILDLFCSQFNLSVNLNSTS